MDASYWQPSALTASTPVSYPVPNFPTGNSPPHPMGVTGVIANMLAQRTNQANANLANGQAMANNSFDWGGNKMVGADSRAFPNHTGSPNSYQMLGSGSAAMGGYGGYGGSSGYGGNGGVGNLAQYYQTALNHANQANEARYQDVLGGYQSRYQRGLQMLAGLGQQEGKDINQLYDSQQSNINQNLIGRGLGNSTVMSTMQMGNDRERNADLGRLNDRIRQQALSQDANLSGDTLQFMASKNDKGPDVGLLAQLAQGMGQAGYGMPGFAGGGGGYGSPSGGSGGGMMGGYTPFYGSSPNAGYSDWRLGNAQQNYAAGNAFQNMLSDYYGPTQSTPVSSDYAMSWQPDAPNLLQSMGNSPIAQAITNGYTDGSGAPTSPPWEMTWPSPVANYGEGYDPSWAGG